MQITGSATASLFRQNRYSGACGRRVSEPLMSCLFWVPIFWLPLSDSLVVSFATILSSDDDHSIIAPEQEGDCFG